MNYYIEKASNDSYRIKDSETNKTKAFVKEIEISEDCFYSMLPNMSEYTPNPYTQTETYNNYRKCLHKRIVWEATGIDKIVSWLVAENIKTSFIRLFRIKDRLYLVDHALDANNKEYVIRAFYVNFDKNVYKKFKLFKDIESWSHYNNIYTYKTDYIPSEWE